MLAFIPNREVAVERLALSPGEAAAALGVSRSKIYGLLRSGELPSVHLGGRRLIRTAAIAALLEAHEERAS